jgi:lysophospholipid acyltransferase (LPLAT)-like uncharacterized protein
VEQASAPAPSGGADGKIDAASLLAAWLIRALGASVRKRHHGDAELRRRKAAGERVILAFWHRHLLLMPFAYGKGRISVLISLHRDGELVARTMERLAYDTTRGSTTRGGFAGLRRLLAKGKRGYDLSFTPDGPRGPATEVQAGVIVAAALTGFPILPIAYAASRCRRLASWDRFIVPWPFSTVHFVYGELLAVPRGGDTETYSSQLKTRLDAAAAEAERLAAGGGSGEG